jgi:hypothetical protein
MPLDVSERGGGSPAEHADVDPAAASDAPPSAHAERGARSAPSRSADPKLRDVARAERVRRAGFHGADAPYARYRIRFAKVGRAAFLGHLDLARLWARTFRRAELELALSRGFSPKPRMAFGPALGLGVPSLGEVMDVELEHAPLHDGVFVRPFAAPDAPRAAVPPDEVAARLTAVCPEGLLVIACEPLAIGAPGLGKLATAVDLAIRPAPDGMAFDAARLARIAAAFLAKTSTPIARTTGLPAPAGGVIATRDDRTIDVRALVSAVDVLAADDATRLVGALGWPDAPALLRVRVSATAAGTARPIEVARALGVWGDDDPRADHALVARLGVVLAEPPPPVAVTPPAAGSVTLGA